MKTTIDLPQELIEEAMRITGSKTMVEAIKKSLNEMIEREKRLQLLNFKGKVDLTLDLEMLRDRKSVL
ncbi:MAG: type II toxin-antitoxin system VapB family antitoxin [Spirosomataceae bacterium]